MPSQNRVKENKTQRNRKEEETREREKAHEGESMHSALAKHMFDIYFCMEMGYPHFYQSDGAYGTVMLYQWHNIWANLFVYIYTCVRCMCTFEWMCLCSFAVMWKIFDIVKTVNRQNESFEKAFAKSFALLVVVRCVQ